MKISSVKATPVILPMTRAAATSMGSGNAVTRTIVEVTTDEGLTGLGETGGAYAAHLILNRFSGRIIGSDPADRHRIRRACVPDILDYGTVEQPAQIAAFAAIEMALWDLAGQIAAAPVYQLLGGAFRPQAPFVAYAFTVDLAEGHSLSQVPGIMAEIAKAEVERTGARMFEFKIARHPVDVDIETVLAVRDRLGPDLEIAVDANMRYSLADARRFLQATRNARLSNIEEPCAQLADCARIGREFQLSVSTHCMDFDALRAHPDVGGVVGAVDAQGGIGRTIELANGALAIGRQYWLRSCVEAGIAWAAMVHLGMACRALERPSQALIQWVEDDLIEGPPWLIRNGGVSAPSLPGLGVTLDNAAFARMAERFAREGELSYFDKA
jgi:glucarate dehydratase